MPEIRKDYFENDYVITKQSFTRHFTVDDYKTNSLNEKNCILCNIKSSKVKPKSNVFETIEPMLKKLNYSLHNVDKNHLIIYGSNHKDTLHENSITQFTDLLEILRHTLGELSNTSNSEYVSLSYNSGIASSIYTSHSRFELITYDTIPPTIDVKSNHFLTSMEDLGICPMCRIVNIELGGIRQVLSTSNFVSFVPWASKVDFEQLIFPKKHQLNFIETDKKDLADLSIYVNKNTPEYCAKLLSKSSRTELAKLVGI